MKDYFMSIDPGKDTLKAVGRSIEGTSDNIKKVSFKTKMYNMADGYIDIEGNSYKVEFQGETFIVGEQGEVSDDSFETSKTSMLHKLCTYVAITQFLEPHSRNNGINIVLACPLSVLRIESAKEEYKAFIKNNGVIEITVDDIDYSFEILNITIKAEDTGIRFIKPELFKDTTVALIGWGGLNFNFQLFRNGVCKSNDRFVEEHGATTLIKYIAEELTAYRKGNIVSYDKAEEALNNGYLTKQGQPDTGSIESIKKAKERFFKDSINIIARNGYQLKDIPSVVVVGGTVSNFEDIVKNAFKHAYIAPNSQWATADGLYKVAFAKYAK